MNYNLLEEKWIPVLYRNGEFDRIGIRKAFEDARKIRQIAASNPMDRFAILRFLLALLYWCKGNPPERIPEDSFPQEWFKKLEDNRDCFNLLGDGKRFYQDSQAKRPQSATQLMQEIPSGNNFWHFRHSTDERDGLCPACCAMGLLRLPLFAITGLSGPKEPNLMSGINGAPPIYVMPWGKSLMETLCENWSFCSNIGEPSWIFQQLPTMSSDVPLLTGLTLLPRRVFLHEPDGQPGLCIGCGASAKSLIKTIEFQTTGKQENKNWNDPHVIYAKRKAIRAEDLTVSGRFRLDRPWHSLLEHLAETLSSRQNIDRFHGLLARIVETGRPVSLFVVGFATNQAKNVDVWERMIEIPSLDSFPQTAVSLIEKWRNQGIGLDRHENIAKSRIEMSAVISSIRPHVEAKVSANAGALLEADEQVWEQAADEYAPLMAAVAASISPGFTSEKLKQRKQIAAIRPDMRQETSGPAERSKRKEATSESD